LTINKCRALFATHYHELTELVESLDFADNACLRAKEWDGDLVFLHDVREGPADKSYGIAVAKLAGVPARAISRAKAVLARLEKELEQSANGLGELPLFSASAPIVTAPAKPSEIDEAISSLDVDALSPRQALDLLYDLKKKNCDN
jgi:DNA mismatch repair protein MutS